MPNLHRGRVTRRTLLLLSAAILGFAGEAWAQGLGAASSWRKAYREVETFRIALEDAVEASDGRVTIDFSTPQSAAASLSRLLGLQIAVQVRAFEMRRRLDRIDTSVFPPESVFVADTVLLNSYRVPRGADLVLPPVEYETRCMQAWSWAETGELLSCYNANRDFYRRITNLLTRLSPAPESLLTPEPGEAEERQLGEAIRDPGSNTVHPGGSSFAAFSGEVRLPGAGLERRAGVDESALPGSEVEARAPVASGRSGVGQECCCCEKKKEEKKPAPPRPMFSLGAQFMQPARDTLGDRSSWGLFVSTNLGNEILAELLGKIVGESRIFEYIGEDISLDIGLVTHGAGSGRVLTGLTAGLFGGNFGLFDVDYRVSGFVKTIPDAFLDPVFLDRSTLLEGKATPHSTLGFRLEVFAQTSGSDEADKKRTTKIQAALTERSDELQSQVRAAEGPGGDQRISEIVSDAARDWARVLRDEFRQNKQRGLEWVKGLNASLYPWWLAYQLQDQEIAAIVDELWKDGPLVPLPGVIAKRPKVEQRWFFFVEFGGPFAAPQSSLETLKDVFTFQDPGFRGTGGFYIALGLGLWFWSPGG